MVRSEKVDDYLNEKLEFISFANIHHQKFFDNNI